MTTPVLSQPIKLPSHKGIWKFHVGPLDSFIANTPPSEMSVVSTKGALALHRPKKDVVFLPVTAYQTFIKTKEGGALRITNPDWITLAGARAQCIAHKLHEHEGGFWLVVCV